MKGEAIGWLIIHVDDKNVGECTKEEREMEKSLGSFIEAIFLSPFNIISWFAYQRDIST